MITIFLSYIYLIPLPANGQEGYTMKERVDEIYKQAREINSKLDTNYRELNAQLISNRERIRVLEIYIWIIGGAAVILGGLIKTVLATYLSKRYNGRVGMDRVWNDKKKE
jgi:hypothetical protein